MLIAILSSFQKFLVSQLKGDIVPRVNVDLDLVSVRVTLENVRRSHTLKDILVLSPRVLVTISPK